MKIQDYRIKLESLKTKRDLLTQQFQEKSVSIEEKEVYKANLDRARWTLSQVALLTQKKFEKYIEDLVTYTIKSVYVTDDLAFKVIFKQAGNKSVCDLMVQDGKEDPFYPRDEMGGGLCDVISFSLKIILWSLQKPRTRNVLYLDEPFKNLGSGDLLSRSVEMMKKVSKELNIQLILNTHVPRLAELADKAYLITKPGGKFAVVQSVTSEMDLSKIIDVKKDAFKSIDTPPKKEIVLQRRVR